MPQQRTSVYTHYGIFLIAVIVGLSLLYVLELPPTGQLVGGAVFHLTFDYTYATADGELPVRATAGTFSTDNITKGSINDASLGDMAGNEYIDYACQNNFNAFGGTMYLWVNFDAFPNHDIVFFTTDDSRYKLHYLYDLFDKSIVGRAGFADAAYYFQSDSAGRNPWYPNDWHLVAMTWTGTTTSKPITGVVKLYIDGNPAEALSFSQGGSCTTFRIGNSYTSNANLDIAQIDELRIFNTVKTDAQISSDYWTELFQINEKVKPIPRIISPASGTTTAATTIAVTFTIDEHLTPIPEYKIFVNNAGVDSGGVQRNTPITRTVSIPLGTSTITVQGRDFAGNTANSTPVTIT